MRRRMLVPVRIDITLPAARDLSGQEVIDPHGAPGPRRLVDRFHQRQCAQAIPPIHLGLAPALDGVKEIPDLDRKMVSDTIRKELLDPLWPDLPAMARLQLLHREIGPVAAAEFPRAHELMVDDKAIGVAGILDRAL